MAQYPEYTASRLMAGVGSLQSSVGLPSLSGSLVDSEEPPAPASSSPAEEASRVRLPQTEGATWQNRDRTSASQNPAQWPPRMKRKLPSKRTRLRPGTSASASASTSASARGRKGKGQPKQQKRMENAKAPLSSRRPAAAPGKGAGQSKTRSRPRSAVASRARSRARSRSRLVRVRMPAATNRKADHPTSLRQQQQYSDVLIRKNKTVKKPTKKKEKKKKKNDSYYEKQTAATSHDRGTSSKGTNTIAREDARAQVTSDHAAATSWTRAMDSLPTEQEQLASDEPASAAVYRTRIALDERGQNLLPLPAAITSNLAAEQGRSSLDAAALAALPPSTPRHVPEGPSNRANRQVYPADGQAKAPQVTPDRGVQSLSVAPAPSPSRSLQRSRAGRLRVMHGTLPSLRRSSTKASLRAYLGGKVQSPSASQLPTSSSASQAFQMSLAAYRDDPLHTVVSPAPVITRQGALSGGSLALVSTGASSGPVMRLNGGQGVKGITDLRSFGGTERVLLRHDASAVKARGLDALCGRARRPQLPSVSCVDVEGPTLASGAVQTQGPTLYSSGRVDLGPRSSRGVLDKLHGPSDRAPVYLRHVSSPIQSDPDGDAVKSYKQHRRTPNLQMSSVYHVDRRGAREGEAEPSPSPLYSPSSATGGHVRRGLLVRQGAATTGMMHSDHWHSVASTSGAMGHSYLASLGGRSEHVSPASKASRSDVSLHAPDTASGGDVHQCSASRGLVPSCGSAEPADPGVITRNALGNQEASYEIPPAVVLGELRSNATAYWIYHRSQLRPQQTGIEEGVSEVLPDLIAAGQPGNSPLMQDVPLYGGYVNQEPRYGNGARVRSDFEHPTEGHSEAVGHPTEGHSEAVGHPTEGHSEAVGHPTEGHSEAVGHPTEGHSEAVGHPTEGHSEADGHPTEGHGEAVGHPTEGHSEAVGHLTEGHNEKATGLALSIAVDSHC